MRVRRGQPGAQRAKQSQGRGGWKMLTTEWEEADGRGWGAR